MNITPNIQNFNNKIQQMNNSNSKGLTLTSIEARNLHSEIMLLLQQALNKKMETIEIDDMVFDLSGGGW